MKIILWSLAVVALIGGSTALVTNIGERARGPKIFHGMSSDDASEDEEIVRVAEADVVGDQREANSQSPTHALTQTATKMREADGIEDADEVADTIEQATQSNVAKIASSVGANADDEEVVRVAEADVVQDDATKVTTNTSKVDRTVAKTEKNTMVEADVKEEQEDNDDDDEEVEDEPQGEGPSVKPHPSVIQMSAPKIKIATVVPTRNNSNATVHTVAPPKQAPSVALNTPAPQVQTLAAKKNLRSSEGKPEEKQDYENTMSDPSPNAEPSSQAQVEETEASPENEEPVAPIRADCNEGNEFSNNDC